MLHVKGPKIGRVSFPTHVLDTLPNDAPFLFRATLPDGRTFGGNDIDALNEVARNAAAEADAERGTRG